MPDYRDAVLIPANAGDRLAWERPTYARMRAGDAEVGPNPDRSDGGFTLS